MKLFEDGIKIQFDARKVTVGAAIALIYFCFLFLAISTLVREIPKVG